MSFLKAQQLMLSAAKFYTQERTVFSKEDIVKKLNDIKYLSAQKKIPRLSLRKEILLLENKLQHVFELEELMTDWEKQESARVAALKQQVTMLKNRLIVCHDADLQKRVDKLSHLLGECLAKQRVKEEVALTTAAEVPQKPGRETQIAALQQRLNLLRQTVIAKEDTNPELAQLLEEKINQLEERLQEVQQETVKLPMSEQPAGQPQVKHTLIFHNPPPQKKY